MTWTVGNDDRTALLAQGYTCIDLNAAPKPHPMKHSL
jgi:hypothetical protein